MTDLVSLVIKADSTDIKHTEKDLKNLNKTSSKTEKATGKMNKGFASLGSTLKKLAPFIAGLGAAMLARKIIQNTIAQENAIKQLEQRLKSTSAVVGITSKELQNLASSLQSVTTFGDESILSMQSILLTFTNIRGEAFERTTEAALNLSIAMGTDLKSSAVQLGKALNAPTQNLSALTRSGIQFTKEQKDVIKALEATGRLAEAQGIILEELETQFGGAARAARDTFGGALAGLGNASNDLLESKGGLKDAKEAVEAVTKSLSDPGTIEAFNTYTAGFFQILNAAVKLTTALANMDKVWSSIKYDANIKRLDNLSESLDYYLGLSDKAFESGDMGVFNEHQGTIQELERAYDSVSQSIGRYEQEVMDYGKAISGIPELKTPVLDVLSSLGGDGKGGGGLPEITKDISSFNKALLELRDLHIQDVLFDINEAVDAGTISWREYYQLMEKYGQTAAESTEEIKNTVIDSSNEYGDVVLTGVNQMSGAFTDMAFDAEKDFGAMTKSILANIAQMLVQMALFNVVKMGLTGTSFGSFLGLAKGGAFNNGNITPMASGGIISQPTIFPMASGGIALAGEAGDEVIMPIGRTSNGDMGVKADIKGSGTVVNIKNYTTAKPVVSESTNSAGQKTIEVLIKEQVNAAIQGGGLDKNMAKIYGNKRVGY